jgi:hypothetical protein
MKKILTVGFFLLVASPFTSLFAQTRPANNYQCTGNGVTLTYSTTSFTGDPRFTITIDGTTISRSGSEIQSQATVLGSLVTIVRRQVPDAFTDTITLVAPDVNVTPSNPTVPFATRLFLTRTHTSIGGPALVEGVIQDSQSRGLSCTASALDF